MKTNSEIRQDAIAFMKGNWKPAVVVTLVYLLTIFVGSYVTALFGKIIGAPFGGSIEEILNLILALLVVYPMTYSLMKLFLSSVRGEQEIHAGGVFDIFKSPNYGKSIGLYALISIYTFLWALLLVVPGIIKSLSYALAPYILADNPELKADEAINRSMEMMQGHKMDLFLIILGYVGLALLSLIALGIPLLWLQPYYHVVFAKFYEEVKAAAIA